jgi:predicted ribosome quality control (RQC) complex YloA/Tae2 family protein
MGDLVTTNLHAMSRGLTALVTGNYYDPSGAEIRITLDPLKTPQQNAAAYYKRYNKAKNAERVLAEQLTEGEIEISYLDSVLDALARAESERDLLDIRAELEAGSYLRRAAKASRRRSRRPQSLWNTVPRRGFEFWSPEQHGERPAYAQNRAEGRCLVSCPEAPWRPRRPLR